MTTDDYYVDHERATLFPVINVQQKRHEVCLHVGQPRLGALDGGVFLLHQDKALVLDAMSARALLAQLQDALGVKPAAVVAPMPPPNPYLPWAPGKVTCGSVTSGPLPGEVVRGYHECEGGSRRFTSEPW